MPMPGIREIVAAKIALQNLLATNLLPDITITRFLAGMPADDRLNHLSSQDTKQLIEGLEGYLIFSVHFLIGRLSHAHSETFTVASRNLEDLLLALLALQPEFKVAEEHYLLLADFYRRRGREEEASALLRFLEQPSGSPN